MVEAYQKFLIAPYVFHRVFGSNVSCFDQFVLTVLLFSFTKGGYEYLKHHAYESALHGVSRSTAHHPTDTQGCHTNFNTYQMVIGILSSATSPLHGTPP